MALIDTHCHIDLYQDPVSIISEVELSGSIVIAVTNAPFVYQACRKLVERCHTIYPAVGLHPELVGEYAHQVDDLIQYLPTTQFVGEIGMDYRVTAKETHEQQKYVFQKIVKACAATSNKIMTIHSRGAESDVVEILENRSQSHAILHWYSGAIKYLKHAQDIGCYFSVNPAMLSSKNGIKILSHINRSRVLTETDGPYTKVDNSRLRPSDIHKVIMQLADIWETDQQSVIDLVTENWTSLFHQ